MTFHFQLCSFLHSHAWPTLSFLRSLSILFLRHHWLSCSWVLFSFSSFSCLAIITSSFARATRLISANRFSRSCLALRSIHCSHAVSWSGSRLSSSTKPSSITLQHSRHSYVAYVMVIVLVSDLFKVLKEITILSLTSFLYSKYSNK